MLLDVDIRSRRLNADSAAARCPAFDVPHKISEFICSDRVCRPTMGRRSRDDYINYDEGMGRERMETCEE